MCTKTNQRRFTLTNQELLSWRPGHNHRKWQVTEQDQKHLTWTNEIKYERENQTLRTVMLRRYVEHTVTLVTSVPVNNKKEKRQVSFITWTQTTSCCHKHTDSIHNVTSGGMSNESLNHIFMFVKTQHEIPEILTVRRSDGVKVVERGGDKPTENTCGAFLESLWTFPPASWESITLLPTAQTSCWDTEYLKSGCQIRVFSTFPSLAGIICGEFQDIPDIPGAVRSCFLFEDRFFFLPVPAFAPPLMEVRGQSSAL